MRDYSRWLNPTLPGKLGGSDIDLALHQAATGRILMVEFKDATQRLNTGQRLLFTALRALGIEVWVVWEYQNYVKAGILDETGEVRFLEQLTPDQLGAKVKAWWYAGLQARP
jgi:hypothetical protein